MTASCSFCSGPATQYAADHIVCEAKCPQSRLSWCLGRLQYLVREFAYYPCDSSEIYTPEAIYEAAKEALEAHKATLVQCTDCEDFLPAEDFDCSERCIGCEDHDPPASKG